MWLVLLMVLKMVFLQQFLAFHKGLFCCTTADSQCNSAGHTRSGTMKFGREWG